MAVIFNSTRKERKNNGYHGAVYRHLAVIFNFIGPKNPVTTCRCIIRCSLPSFGSYFQHAELFRKAWKFEVQSAVIWQLFSTFMSATIYSLATGAVYRHLAVIFNDKAQSAMLGAQGCSLPSFGSYFQPKRWSC